MTPRPARASALDPQGLADSGERFVLCLAVLVHIDLLSDGQAGMTQDELSVTRRNGEVQQMYEWTKVTATPIGPSEDT